MLHRDKRINLPLEKKGLQDSSRPRNTLIPPHLQKPTGGRKPSSHYYYSYRDSDLADPLANGIPSSKFSSRLSLSICRSLGGSGKYYYLTYCQTLHPSWSCHRRLAYGPVVVTCLSGQAIRDSYEAPCPRENSLYLSGGGISSIYPALCVLLLYYYQQLLLPGVFPSCQQQRAKQRRPKRVCGQQVWVPR